MTDDREGVLARIREALQVPPAERHSHHTKQMAELTPFREWLPRVGAAQEERLSLFARQSEVLRTELHHCADMAAAAAHLSELASAARWRRIALHPAPLLDALDRLLPPELERLRVTAGYDESAMEQCDAGVTECECLVAQTGSVCVTSLSSGGRSLSVLPPHHVVIARREQLVPDLSAAYELLARKYGSNYPSFISFISGPSRTGDIERILVLGAHGPRRLTVLLLP